MSGNDTNNNNNNVDGLLDARPALNYTTGCPEISYAAKVNAFVDLSLNTGMQKKEQVIGGYDICNVAEDNKLINPDHIIIGARMLFEDMYGLDSSIFIDPTNPDLCVNEAHLEVVIADVINDLILKEGPYTEDNALFFMYTIAGALNDIAPKH